jgi:hypothetical protein
VTMTRRPMFIGALATSALLLLAACDDNSAGTMPQEEPGTTGGTHGEPPPGDAYGEPPPPEPEAAPPGDPAAPPQDPMGPGTPQGDAGDISSSEIEIFSSLQIELMQLQQNLQQRAQAGEDPQTLQQEMDRKALEIVEGSDLSVTRFETIARQAQNDPELRQQIETKMRQQVGG